MTSVLVERKGRVCLITLNRPEARNAVDPEMAIRLASAWEEVRDDSEIRVAIVTGAGNRAFCAGADLKRLVSLVSGTRSPENVWDEAFIANPEVAKLAFLRDFDPVKPVIAAINGYAVGAGMELVQGTDIRIAARDAMFGLPEVKWGIFPSGGSTVRLPWQIPAAIALELLLTGEVMDAGRAYDIGFVNHVAENGDVVTKAFEIAERIAANGPIAVQQVRRSARACMGLSELAGLKLEGQIAAPVYLTEDGREGVSAFAEKRAPLYSGR